MQVGTLKDDRELGRARGIEMQSSWSLGLGKHYVHRYFNYVGSGNIECYTASQNFKLVADKSGVNFFIA